MLPPSAVGELAAFARRSGDQWFVGVLNGPGPRALELDLGFLGQREVPGPAARATRGRTAAAVELEERDVTRGDTLALSLRAGAASSRGSRAS